MFRRIAPLAALVIMGACGSDHSLAGPDGGPGISASVLAAGTTYVGDRIRTTDNANIRSTASITGTMLGVQPNGATGTVIGGPVYDAAGDKLTRWQIDFDTGVDGWAAANYLDQTSGTAVASVTVTPGPASAAIGTTLQLTATPKDAAGVAITGQSPTWSSSNAALATVSASGLVSAVAPGAVTISATSRGTIGSAVISVARFVTGSRVHPHGNANIRATASATGTLLGPQPDSISGVVTAGPVVDVTGDGLTRWQVDFDNGPDGWAAEDYLTTSTSPTPPASVMLARDTATIIIGRTLQLSAVAKDATGTSLPSATMSWMSLDTLTAKVTATGLVTGVAAGTAFVVASSGGRSDSARVSVIPVPVASIALTPATATVAPAATVQLTATPKDSAGAALTGRTMTWTSSNAAAATVSATGLVRGVAAGAATITASSGGKSATAAITVAAQQVVHSGRFVSPTGSTTTNGSITQPWTLAYALSGAGGKVLPGDTVWLRGGTYRGQFNSTVNGTAGSPIVFRQYPGERATIDGAGTPSTQQVFNVRGAYTILWGFEITNTDPVRTTTSTSHNARPNVVANYGSHNKYVNLIVHDGGVAFYTEPIYTDVEIIGCIVYNNGWQGPDRGHGHALYLKAFSGPVVVRDNVLFNQFGYGVHAYSDAGTGALNNIQVIGNVAFNNGTLSNNSNSANILVGGAARASGDLVSSNYTYFSPGKGGTNVQLGMGSLLNADIQVQNNYFAGGAPVMDVGYWTSFSASGNTFAGTGSMVTLNNSSVAGYSFSGNTWQRDLLAAAWRFRGTAYPLAGWRTATGLGLGDLAVTGLPSATKVVVRASTMEPGRANIIVYNWGKVGSVAADLSGVLAAGDRYEVRNVQNIFGAPVLSGTFSGGSLMVPITTVTPPTPVGMSSSAAPSTGTDFQVFVVTKI